MHFAVDSSKLRELAQFEASGDFEGNLSRLVALVGELLAAQRASLMLLDTGGDAGTALRLVALHGELPSAAWEAKPKLGEGIAGGVLASGRMLAIEDIGASELKAAARRPGTPGSLIVCPVPIAGEAAGVLSVSELRHDAPLAEHAGAITEFAAVLLGRAIHLMRLQRLLDSRFAQMAMILGGERDSGAVVAMGAREPEKVAKMLAKAFYRELRHCGFTSNQILHAAGEIISELTTSLNRHRKRLSRSDGDI